MNNYLLTQLCSIRHRLGNNISICRNYYHHVTVCPAITHYLSPSLSGYSGPLKDVPYEKFNVTIVPKSYCSPWEEQNDSEALLANINANLPEPPLKSTPDNYKSFNR